ncbi:hypothetical protein F444_00499 [Phytophthora nicotianae P1976]|uniref:HNH nuclease domain-containing protein n=2 Tax=Phytophthora nicotianae TaxID=4792 RepID=A0A081B457_PHYNI|nr:hypothetical protein F444_00499 [Phytophthora nicotianae P1976]
MVKLSLEWREKAIKDQSDGKIGAPWLDLRLFLAKKDEAWLTENDLKEGVSDTSDLEQLDVAGAPLNLVGLSEKDVKFVPTLEDVESMNTPVHVLVVVPPPDETTSPYAVIAATLFQHTFSNVPSTTASKTQKLKKQLVKKYKCDCGRNKNDDAMLLCMVINVALPSTVVIASHIFRREHDDLKEHFVQIADIDDVRNGLLLFKPIESAFDDLDISFLVDKHDRFTLKIFNTDIKAHLLVDRLTQPQWEEFGGESLPTHWRTSTRPIYAPNAPEFDVLTTFGELDGKTLWFPSGSTLRPFRRCL